MLIDIEGEATRFLENRGFDSRQSPHMISLAYAALGPRNVFAVPRMRVAARMRGDILEVRPSAWGTALGYRIAHELAEWHLARAAWPADVIERYADRLGAALVVPRPALRAAIAQVGRHLPTLSLIFGTTESIIALRLGEVTGSPLALVTPRTVHARGEWEWPDTATVREWAKRPPPFVTRTVLGDDRRRVVLEAA